MHTQIFDFLMSFITMIIGFMKSCTFELLGVQANIFIFLLGLIVVLIIANQFIRKAGV